MRFPRFIRFRPDKQVHIKAVDYFDLEEVGSGSEVGTTVGEILHMYFN